MALPPLAGHPSMKDVFSPADLIVRLHRSFTGRNARHSSSGRGVTPLMRHTYLGTCCSSRRHRVTLHNTRARRMHSDVMILNSGLLDLTISSCALHAHHAVGFNMRYVMATVEAPAGAAVH